MSGTITVNEEIKEWKEELNLFQVFRDMGYTLKVPAVLVRVNGELVRKSTWNQYVVPNGAVLQVVNVFRGG